MKLKNTLGTSIDVCVIREIVTTLAPNEEKEIAIDPATERIEIEPTPTT